jgi:hypothetical protein
MFKKLKKLTFWLRVFTLVKVLASNLVSAADDKKITITEAFKVINETCEYFGIEFDKQGLDIETLKWEKEDK